MGDASIQLRDGGEGESREADVVDGFTAADISFHHRGAADRFNTLRYQRRTKQKVVTDFATGTKGAPAGVKPRAALRQSLFSQGASERSLSSEERAQLDVLKQELEAYAVPVSLKWRWSEETQGTTLEKNWTDIVHSHSTMSKTQRHQQEALWEFVHTELTYINKLIIIKDVVVAALVNLHLRGFLLEVTPELLFSNLPSILGAHQLFWQEVIYPMLQEVRTTGRPFDPMMLEPGCLQFHERFSSYRLYCWEEENNLEFARRHMESNPHFLTYIQWVETHPQCERMRLGDMQAQPHQRITKYPLLLKAVLKNTEDPYEQTTLRGLLSSVKSFLQSINDFLSLKDDKLALSISALRVEGYEAEGINEEIDKRVKEICQFDLTCPIRGVGPGVIRKLLLEENLKIRGRKDSKLEVVALLFSDVLLMTKVQKKGERLKVVRPPLALDRTYCIALKDSCSFVLVEVGELRCAMNVYIFAASTSESCSTWISTIHQAKETLRKVRETENKRQLEKLTEDRTEDMDIIKQSLTDSGEEVCVDGLSDELVIPQSVNGISAMKEAEEQYQHPDEAVTSNAGLPLWQSQSNNAARKSLRKRFGGWQQAVQDHEWIEMGVRRRRSGSNTEEDGKMIQSQMRKEQINYEAQSAPNLGDGFMSGHSGDPIRHSSPGAHSLVPGGYPDVDYPTDEPNGLHLPLQPIPRAGLEFLTLPGERWTPTRRDLKSQSFNQDAKRNTDHMYFRDIETFPEDLASSKNQASPGLQRRRPLGSHQAPSTQMSRQKLQDSGLQNNSPSNSDSDCNRSHVSPGQSSDSHLVLKLGSLKPNRGMFWNMNDTRVSPDPQTWSEPELPYINNKRPQIKTQRSSSTPNIIIPEQHGVYLPSSRLYIPARNPNRPTSELDGLLERAKGRVRDREELNGDTNRKKAKSRYPPASPSFSKTASLPAGGGYRDADVEEEVQLRRPRALSVSNGWREQLVDGDEDDKINSVVTNGVNVDWLGWCVDDDEVMNQLQPGGEGQSLLFWYLPDLSEQEEGECSQV